MHNIFKGLFWSSLAVMAAADATGIVEFDAIFPRNETYELMPLMPVVFAVRNPALAMALRPELAYTIFSLDSPNATTPYHYPGEVVDLELPGNDTTHFVFQGIAHRFNTEGTWRLIWQIRAHNCSISDDPRFRGEPYDVGDFARDGFHVGTYNPIGIVDFSTRRRGSKADLVKGCQDFQGKAFNIKGDLDIPKAMQSVAHSTECVSLASPTPTPQPCIASIKPDVAASISSRITATECKTRISPAVTCPPEDDDGGAQGISGARHSAWFMVAVFGLIQLIAYG